MLLQVTFHTATLPLSRIHPPLPAPHPLSQPQALRAARLEKWARNIGPLRQSCRIFRVRRKGICSPHNLPVFASRTARPPAPAPASTPLPAPSESGKQGVSSAGDATRKKGMLYVV